MTHLTFTLARELVDPIEQLAVDEHAEGDQAAHRLTDDDRPAGERRMRWKHSSRGLDRVQALHGQPSWFELLA